MQSNRVRDFVIRELVTVEQTTPIAEIARQMSNQRVGSAIVVEDGTLVGILTERDIVRVVAEGADPEKTPAADYMSRQVATIQADEVMAEAARVMIAEQIRHLPVVENEQLLGVLSIRNIVQWSVRQAQDEGRHLPQLMDLV